MAEATDLNLSDFPHAIRVHGMQWDLQGWNNIYTRTKELSDGAPTYVLPSYVLYGFITIAEAEILRIERGDPHRGVHAHRPRGTRVGGVPACREVLRNTAEQCATRV